MSVDEAFSEFTASLRRYDDYFASLKTTKWCGCEVRTLWLGYTEWRDLEYGEVVWSCIQCGATATENEARRAVATSERDE